MGEVIAFPRKARRREHSAAELERVRDDVDRMMASGFSEDEAFEVVVMRMRIEGSHGD